MPTEDLRYNNASVGGGCETEPNVHQVYVHYIKRIMTKKTSNLSWGPTICQSNVSARERRLGKIVCLLCEPMTNCGECVCCLSGAGVDSAFRRAQNGVGTNQRP